MIDKIESKAKLLMTNFSIATFLLTTTFSGVCLQGIISIVYQATGWKMPTWLGWTLIGVASVSVVIGLISTVGGVAIAPALAKSILAADSVSL